MNGYELAALCAIALVSNVICVCSGYRWGRKQPEHGSMEYACDCGFKIEISGYSNADVAYLLTVDVAYLLTVMEHDCSEGEKE